MNNSQLQHSPLGKKSDYHSTYNPAHLFPIPRKMNREKINIQPPLLFHGVDIWNGFELSWLNAKGMPQIAIGEFIVPADSPNIVESKSFKLYLNSLNQTKFQSFDDVKNIIEKDLLIAAGAPVAVRLIPAKDFAKEKISTFDGICLDDRDIEVDHYDLNVNYLKSSPTIVHEVLHSNLLKSNCMVTNQPDWASVMIDYQGPQIDHDGLLRYLISFRSHNEFHEPCVERIFMDILKNCHPEKLTVYGRFTRRGGLDINPFRSNWQQPPANVRHARQ